MKRYFHLFFLLLTTPIIGQNQVEMAAIKSAVRRYYEDRAFKLNTKFSLLEISDLTYELVGENTLDTLRLLKNKQNYDRYVKVSGLYSEQATSYKILKESSEDEASAKVFAGEIVKSAKTAILYLDSSLMVLALDSIIRKRMESRILMKSDDPQKYYKVVYQLRGTILGQNILDRFVLYLTRKYKVVNLD